MVCTTLYLDWTAFVCFRGNGIAFFRLHKVSIMLTFDFDFVF